MQWTVIYADAVLKVMAAFHLFFSQPFSEATHRLAFAVTLQLVTGHFTELDYPDFRHWTNLAGQRGSSLAG